MDLRLSDEERSLLETARRVGRHFPARARRHDDEASFPRENFDELRAAGLLSLTVPREFGGHGLWSDGRFLAYYLVMEELARHCSSTAQLLQVHCHAVGIIAGLGTAAQKAVYMPRVVDDGCLFASCGSEAGVGRKGAKFDTILSGQDGELRLNGFKAFASLAPDADYLLVWTLAEGTSSMADGLIFVVVPRDAEGLAFEDNWDTLGMRSTVSWNFSMKDTPVVPEQVVSNPGDWVQREPRSFTLAYAANHLGAAQGVYDAVLDYISDRPELRASAIIQVDLAEADTKIAATRYMMWHAAWLWEQGQYDEAEIDSMRALHLSKQTALWVANKAFDICGARATFRQFPLEQALRDIRTFTLHFREDKILQMLAQAKLGEGEPFHSKLRYGPKRRSAGAQGSAEPALATR